MVMRTGAGWPSLSSNTVSASGLPPGLRRSPLRCGVQSLGLKLSAALGISSTLLCSATRNEALAVIPGSSAPSGFATATTTV